jgi:hypothetical protein
MGTAGTVDTLDVNSNRVFGDGICEIGRIWSISKVSDTNHRELALARKLQGSTTVLCTWSKYI